MKIMLALFIALISINVFSSSHNAKIEKIFCGEWDAYYIGDACILFLQDMNEKSIVIYDIDMFTEFLDLNNIDDFRELDGQEIQFNKNKYQVVTDKNLLYEFKHYEKDVVFEHYDPIQIKLK